jgi:hypothetical protein
MGRLKSTGSSPPQHARRHTWKEVTQGRTHIVQRDDMKYNNGGWPGGGSATPGKPGQDGRKPRTVLSPKSQRVK